MYWIARGVGPNVNKTHSVSFDITGDTKYHLYKVDFASSSTYSGSAFGLRFDPVGNGLPMWTSLSFNYHYSACCL